MSKTDLGLYTGITYRKDSRENPTVHNTDFFPTIEEQKALVKKYLEKVRASSNFFAKRDGISYQQADEIISNSLAKLTGVSSGLIKSLIEKPHLVKTGQLASEQQIEKLHQYFIKLDQENKKISHDFKKNFSLRNLSISRDNLSSDYPITKSSVTSKSLELDAFSVANNPYMNAKEIKRLIDVNRDTLKAVAKFFESHPKAKRPSDDTLYKLEMLFTYPIIFRLNHKLKFTSKPLRKKFINRILQTLSKQNIKLPPNEDMKSIIEDPFSTIQKYTSFAEEMNKTTELIMLLDQSSLQA